MGKTAMKCNRIDNGEPADEPVPLQLVLAQTQEVQAKVEACAEDIGSSNVAVEKRIHSGVTTLSAHKALTEGKVVESKVLECADDLHQVNEALAQGIDDLRQTEFALAESRQALAESEAALALAQEGEREAREQALHDSTTGLPNRDLFDTRLEHAISLAKRHGWTLAVMFLDLDRFKSVNDLHGHDAGDEVLKMVADRLARHAREEDTVCRNGGDEFLYLLVNPQGRNNIERIARGIVGNLARPIALGEVQLVIETSIGIAVYPEHGESPEQLIRKADTAMYHAKGSGAASAFFDSAEEIVPA